MAAMENREWSNVPRQNDFRTSQAVNAAAQAAAAINQKLGVSGNSAPPPTPPQNPMANLGAPQSGMGSVITEEFFVPDRMVGLIIGKGGEQITRLQAESGCKVQIAPDSGGLPDRSCTLTGSQQSIERVKELIHQIIRKGQAPLEPNVSEGHTMVELMVPGTKVGLIIGKGGETIKQLQERAGVKMVMIQDSNQPTQYDKPLRITGEPMKCQRAKDMVLDLLAEKEMESMRKPGGFPNGDYGEPGHGGGGRGNTEIKVPRFAVGVVIGKGGDMIKKIQQDTSARVQFQPDDGQSNDRTCTITGSPECVQQAASMIQDLIQNATNRGGPGGPMGRGRGRGRDDMGGPGGRFDGRGPGGPQGGPPGGRFGGDANFQDETTYSVPGDKCGLVIGKGGETIREIKNQSGAYVELQRGPPPNPGQKVFTIKGNPQQIQHAIQLICEKAGLGPGPNGPGGPGGPAGPGGPMQGGPMPGGYGDQYGGQQNQQAPPQSYAPQGWGNAYPQQWGAQNNQSDPNKQSNDPTAAAWAAYYAQYYQQGGVQQNPQQQQQQPPQQQQQQQQQPVPQQPPQQQQQPPQQTQQQAAVNPQTGQPDYSLAWAEYYRSQGLHYHAQAILQQAGHPSGGAPQQPQQ